MRRLGVVIACLAIGCTSIAGCGGSGDEEAIPDTVADYVPPEGITVEEWRTQMGAVCEAFQAQPDPFAGREEPDDPDEAMALLGQLLPLVDELVASLAAVPPPAGRVRDLEQLQLDIEELRAILARGTAAADARDFHAVYAEIMELSRQFTVVDARLADLDVTACR